MLLFSKDDVKLLVPVPCPCSPMVTLLLLEYADGVLCKMILVHAGLSRA